MSTFLTGPVLVMLATSPAHAACEEAGSVMSLRLLMRQAEEAYRELDIEGFRTSLDAASTELPCLDAALPIPDIARYHRLQGLLASVVRDQDRAQAAFLSSRALEPTFRLPLDMVPAEHPTRLDYAALPLDSVRWEALPEPLEGTVQIDGTEQLRRPLNRPAIVQRFDDAGAVIDGAYLWPEESLDYPIAVAQTRHRSRWLMLGAAGAAAAAGGLTAAAASARASYDAESDLDALDALKVRTNTASGLSVGAGAASAGLAAAAVIAWEW